MKHLFVMDPFEKLNLSLDSSLRMAFALTTAKDQCFFTTPWDLRWQGGEKYVAARTAEILFGQKVDSARLSPQSAVLSLADFDFVHMRKDPPYDLDYVGTTWLLDAAPPSVRILNSPSGLRSVNEKLGILLFPEYCDKALASSDAHEIFDFIRAQCHGDAVVKPLHLYGGKGIERVQIGSSATKHHEALVKLQQLTSEGRTIKLVQPFNPKIYEGEVRVFTVLGEPLAWCLKIPTDGQFLANSNFGSTRHQYSPSAAEDQLVRTVARRLMNEFKIYVVGFDLIAGKLSEINTTSPRLLAPPGDDSHYYEKFAQLIHQWQV